MLGAAEHEGLLARVLFQEGFQQLGLVALRREIDALHDPLHRFAGWRDLHLDRIAQIGLGEILDQFRHGGREEQRLALQRQVAGNLAQRMDEAHVEHVVGSSRTR